MRPRTDALFPDAAEGDRLAHESLEPGRHHGRGELRYG